MVNIKPLKPYLPKDPKEFVTKPYDVIDKEEENELKKNPNSLIHLILPDGEGDELYQNALKAYERFKKDRVIEKENTPSIFVYRQESPEFSQQGLILGVSLEDYEKGNIIKHEHTREKPLKDRTKNITTTMVSAGLVWNVFQSNREIKEVIEKIKKKDPKFRFDKYGYTHILWQETDPKILEDLLKLFKNEKIFIADGHHRAASAAECRKKMMTETGEKKLDDKPWNYLLTYVASDDQIRIMAYNRVIKELPMDPSEFLEKLESIFEIELYDEPFNPKKKNEIAICLKGEWYKLKPKQENFKSIYNSLDVSIIQDKVLNPILGIKDVRASENIFFIGGVTDPKEMEKYVTEKGNDLFINLYPVDFKDLEKIADKGGVMPPKSTWFDPKLLSGLILHDLKEF